MEQNFVRQNGFLKISSIAVTANFYAQECCAYDRRAVCLLIDYLHTHKLTRDSMCAEMAWFVVVETLVY